jgi:O-antigen/teichoic acid export membrane protein
MRAGFGSKGSSSGEVRRPGIVDTGAALAATIGNAFLAVPTSILIARTLGPEGKGAVTLVLLIVAQTSMALSLGVEVSFVHYAGRRVWPVRELSSAAIGLGVLLGLLASGCVVLLMSTVFESRLPDDVIVWAYMLVAAVPPGLVGANLSALMRAQGRLVEVHLLTLAVAIMSLMAAGLVAAMGWGAGQLLGLTALIGVLSAVALGALAFRYGILPPSGPLHFRRERQLVLYGLKGHVGDVLQVINYRLDALLLAVFLSLRDVGIYSVSVTAAEILWILPNALASFILQRSATREAGQATALTAAALRMNSGLLALGALALGLVGGSLIRLLFGTAFASAATAMVLLLPGVWALGLWKIIVHDLAGRGYPTVRSVSAAIAAILTIILALALIPPLGIAGAALATTVAYIAAFGSAAWSFGRITGLSTWRFLIPSPRDVVTLAGAVKQLVNRRVAGP